MSTQLLLVIDELTAAGAVKVEAESYSNAWLLRNRINGELRRLGVKEIYTSAVIDNTLLVWKVEMFGGKGSKHLVMDALDTFITTYTFGREGDPSIKKAPVDKVFEEVKKERKESADKRLDKLIDRMGGK